MEEPIDELSTLTPNDLLTSMFGKTEKQVLLDSTSALEPNLIKINNLLNASVLFTNSLKTISNPTKGKEIQATNTILCSRGLELTQNAIRVSFLGNYVSAFTLHRSAFEIGILMRVVLEPQRHSAWIEFVKSRQEREELNARKGTLQPEEQERRKLLNAIRESFRGSNLRKEFSQGNAPLEKELRNFYDVLCSYTHPDARTFGFHFIEENGQFKAVFGREFIKQAMVDSMAVASYNLKNMVFGIISAYSTEIENNIEAAKAASELMTLANESVLYTKVNQEKPEK